MRKVKERKYRAPKWWWITTSTMAMSINMDLGLLRTKPIVLARNGGMQFSFGSLTVHATMRF